MASNTEQSSNANGQGSMLNRWATSILRWSGQFMSGLWSAAWSAMVLLALALTVGLELMTIRRRQSKTPNPTTRKLPIPVRSGGEIFAIMPDGERVKVEPLAAKTHAMAWVDAISGVAVYEKTRVPD